MVRLKNKAMADPRGSRAGLTRRLLIAASDRANASGSLDGYRPATATPTVVAIIAIPAMLTVARTAYVNRNTAGTNVYALREGRCRSRGNHCASEAEREQR